MSSVAHPPTREDDDSLDEGDVYEMLGNRRRRYALQYLRTSDGPVAIGELAEHVAAEENDVPPEAVSPGQRKSVYTALHQNHLPKLTDAGLVRAEREWVGIELTPLARQYDFELGVRTRETRRWDRHLVAAAFITASAVAGFVLGIVHAPVSPVGASATLLGTVLVLVAAAVTVFSRHWSV
jgi:hypothetical protein